ncbi:MAG: MarR family transcriptional regulator [bacterium]
MTTLRKKLIEEFLEVITTLNRSISSRKDLFLQKYNLTRQQAELLYFVERHKNNSIKTIATFMNTTGSAATQLVEGMVKSGYIERTQSLQDRRSVVITLSKQGKKKFSEFKNEHILHITKVVRNLTDKEVQQLIMLRKKLISDGQ